jgi:CHAD domain-containing protein
VKRLSLANRQPILGPTEFTRPGEYDVEQFINESSDPYVVKKERAKTETIRIYDTFDWRLFNKSLVFYSSGDKLHLRKLSEREILYSVTIPSVPVFIWEFPPGKLKEQLAAVIDVRALLKLAEIHSRSRPYRLLDREGKTVVRLVYEEIRSSRDRNAPALAAHLRLEPVRGYSKHYQRIARRFEQAGLTVSTEDEIYFKGLKASDKTPGSYSSKLAFQLDPAMRADEAAKVILRFLLRIIRVNAAHIEEDIDTEFIHDFRVAIRRTRAALGQIRSVFPAETTERFKEDFAFLGQLTNELRDLDVCLLKEDGYKAKVAPVLRNDIEPLFDYLRKKRSEAFQKVVDGLKSKRYAAILNEWETFLNTAPEDSRAAANAGVPAITLARRRIFKKYKSVVKTGNSISESTDDRMLHVLRIHCKKLRYLMEFFASLFHPETINSLIDQLKRLQDNLGDFNDLRVQEEYLLNVAKQLPVSRGQTEIIFLAIGSLVGALAGDRKIVRNAFAETFADFSAPANKELFENLFAGQAPLSDP